MGSSDVTPKSTGETSDTPELKMTCSFRVALSVSVTSAYSSSGSTCTRKVLVPIASSLGVKAKVRVRSSGNRSTRRVRRVVVPSGCRHVSRTVTLSDGMSPRLCTRTDTVSSSEGAGASGSIDTRSGSTWRSGAFGRATLVAGSPSRPYWSRCFT